MDQAPLQNSPAAVGRPMLLGVDTLLNNSWQTYQKHFVSLLKITIVMFIPAVLIALWSGLGFLTKNIPPVVNIVVIVILALVTFVISLWGSLALLRSAQRITQTGVALSVAQAYGEARSLLLPYLWIGIEMAVIILLYVAVPLVLGLLLLSPSIGILGNIIPHPSTLVTLIASALIVALTIAGLVVAFSKSIAFSQSYYLLLEKDLRGMAALRASQELVTGYWWAVLGRLLLLGLILMLIQGVITGVFGLFGDIWSAAAGVIFNIIAAPFSIVYSYGLFRSLRAVKPQL